jgi:hypothetical protein
MNQRGQELHLGRLVIPLLLCVTHGAPGDAPRYRTGTKRSSAAVVDPTWAEAIPEASRSVPARPVSIGGRRADPRGSDR